MSDELKPCKHCGGEARFQIFDTTCNVECRECGIGTRNELLDNLQVCVDAWNRSADDAPINEKHVPSLKESTEDTQALSDSREQLEADVREICWGHDFYRRDAQKRYLHERGLDVRENIVTTNYDGHVLATVIMHMLDRQDSITERELCDRCSPYATAKDYLDTIDSLTAERDGLRKQLAEKQRVIDVQRNSFAKMERECAELRRMLADAAEAI